MAALAGAAPASAAVIAAPALLPAGAALSAAGVMASAAPGAALGLSAPALFAPASAAFASLSAPAALSAPRLQPAAVAAVAPAADAPAAAALSSPLPSAPAAAPAAASSAERPSAADQLRQVSAAWAKPGADADVAAREALEIARTELYRRSGGSADSGDAAKARLSLASRADYFRSPAFRGWVAAEKAAGRQVIWLKDIDKTQAAGDIFTYFFQWRAQNGKITPAQNQIVRDFLKTVTVSDAGLKAELAAVDRNDAKTNALLVLKLWRNKEHGGEGVGLLDVWSKVYWPTQKGLTREEKLAEARAFAPEYARRVYPGLPEENRALTEAGVEVVAVSNGDQELAEAVAGQLGLKPENVVGSNLTYDASGLATGVNHAYEMFDKEWVERPQPGKHLIFHYWINANKSRWGWTQLDKSRVVIAGADGDSAATDGGMWVYFPDKAIGNFMIDTPHEPGRVVKSRALAAKYGWGAGRFFTLTHGPASPSDWDDVPPQR